MHENVPHSVDFLPGDLGLLSLAFGGQRAGALADDLQVIQHPGSDEFVPLKLLLPCAGVFLDSLGWLRGCRASIGNRPSYRHCFLEYLCSDALTHTLRP